MKKNLYLLFAAILVVMVAPAIAVADQLDVTPLNNKDVLLMVERKVSTEAIIDAIKSSPCTFDTFPSVMKEMKRRGVPEDVLLAMLDAPYGPAADNQTTEDLVEEPIYHFSENIKQFLTPVATSRGRYTPTSRRARAARRMRR